MAGEDKQYIRFIRNRPCSAQSSRCRGDIVPHHATVVPPGWRNRGKAQRNQDYLAIALCWLHHIDFHSLSGFFKGWTYEELRAWQLAQIDVNHMLWEGTF